MNLFARIKFIPGAVKTGLDMGVSKRGLIKGCVRFLFKGSFRKRNKLFTMGTYTVDSAIELSRGPDDEITKKVN